MSLTQIAVALLGVFLIVAVKAQPSDTVWIIFGAVAVVLVLLDALGGRFPRG